jgi:hypothetical protein
MSLIDQSSAANARRTIGGVTLTITNIIALRNLSGPDLMGLVQTQYGSTFQDGLGATYIWNQADTSPDNGSTVIAPYVGPPTGRWNQLATTAPAASSTVSVATIAALKAISAPNSSITYIVQGYYAPGDEGGGSFIWEAADTTPDNLGSTIALNSGGTGRFVRIYNSTYLSPLNFGAYGDGQSHPISSATAASINAAYAIGAVAGDETDWVAMQVAIDVVGQVSITPNTPNNAYRYGSIVTAPQRVMVTNKTVQTCFGVWLKGSGKTSFSFDVSGAYPTGTIINYTGVAGAAAINMTGFVVATGLPVAYNVVMHGSDIDNGTYTACEGCQVTDLTVYTAVPNVTYGINISGAPGSDIDNVMIKGFETGLNTQAIWGTNIRCQVIATLIGCNMGNDTNGCTFNLYLNCTSSATVGSICLQTDFVRACTFESLVCEHAQYAIWGERFIASCITSLYCEDISVGCVEAISVLGLTITGVYFNCVNAWGFDMQNFSSITASMALIESVASVPQIAAVVNASAAGSSITLIGFTPTAAERTKDFGSGGMITYINSPDGTGNVVNWTMAVGRTIKISMPDNLSQYVNQIQVNQSAQWDEIYGINYFRLRDLVNNRYAFQFNFIGGIGNAGGPCMLIEDNQVVGIRRTGYSEWTGAQDRSTVFDPTTVSVQQLAQRVSAMQSDLSSATGHGLFGP